MTVIAGSVTVPEDADNQTAYIAYDDNETWTTDWLELDVPPGENPVDDIVDLVFTATEDVKHEHEDELLTAVAADRVVPPHRTTHGYHREPR